MTTPNFVHLHCHSYMSLRDGAGTISDYIKKIKADGQVALALTEHGNLYSHIDLYKECKKQGIKAIIGIEAYMCDDIAIKGEKKKGKGKKEEENSFVDDNQERLKKDRYHLILLAKNNIGYKNLLKLVSISNREGFYYKPRLDKKTLEQYSEGLICLSACLGSEINQYIIHDMYDEAEGVILEYKNMFGEDFYLEVMNHQDDPLEAKVVDIVQKFAKKYDIKIVATNDVHYANQEDHVVQDALIALRDKTTLDDVNLKRFKSTNYYLKTRQEMLELFPDHPEYLEESFNIAEKCNIEIKQDKVVFPEFVKGEDNKKNMLRELCVVGWSNKIKPLGLSKELLKTYADRVKYELEVITENKFADYFLLVEDIVRFATNNNILMSAGRGSVGGSLVAYLLNITKIDPIKYDLYFSRFLNKGRISPPDIDLDFPDTRRDEVVQYAKNKYGEKNFAKVLTFGNFQPKAALRDAFRVYNHPVELQNEMSKLIPDVIQGIPNLKFKYLYGEDPEFLDAVQPKLLEAKAKYPKEFWLAEKLEDNPRHASTHASAYIIADTDIAEYAPIDYDGEGGEVRLGIDMYAGEYIKLLKMDFLGIETLTILDNALKLIEERTGEKIDIYSLPEDDKKTWDSIKRGDTKSIFQFESDGMRGLLKKAKPNDINQLADCCAIYRPGAAKFIDEYCAVKNGFKDISYFHPKMESVLKPTFGQLIYQESIIKMSQLLAGFDESEGDIIRKAIGKKDKEEVDKGKKMFAEGCDRQKLDKELTLKIVDWMTDMSRYNFNKSHAVGYSVNAYSAAYIKANYIFEFVLAALNKKVKEYGDYLKRYQDALSHGIKINGPNVNISDKMATYIFSEDGEPKIYFGMNMIKGVGSLQIESIVKERQEKGDFKNLADFLYRTLLFIDKGTLLGLVKSGSLDVLEPNRGVLYAASEAFLAFQKKIKTRFKRKGGYEFTNEIFTNEFMSQLDLSNVTDLDQSKRIEEEKEVIGFYVSGSLLDDFSKKLIGEDYKNFAEINTSQDGDFVKVGCIITSSRIIQDKNKNEMAFIELEDSYGQYRGVVFASSYEKYKSIIKRTYPVEIKGRISKGSILVNTITKLKNDEE